MNLRKLFCFFSAVFAASLLVPLIASAHEVYVLSSTEITSDLLQPPINLFTVAKANGYEFLLWGFIGILAVACVLGISISHKVGKFIDPFLLRIKPYAGHVAQITIGLALIASAYYGALFGTELPLSKIFGSYTDYVSLLLYVSGFSILFGLYPRIGSIIALVVYLWATLGGTGVYMLSYMTYFGEAFVILLFGGAYTVAQWRPRLLSNKHRIIALIEKRKYFLLRMFFSLSLMYAALYAKLIHGALALNTVEKYHLVNYFHFNPLFIVLGAFLVEMSIGLFYLIGFEVRFTSLFFLAFLTMSLVFFGESVWPHIILIGTAIAMFVHGYDEFTVERVWYKKGKSEPVL